MLQKQFVTVWISVPFYLHYNIQQTAAKLFDLTTTVFCIHSDLLVKLGNIVTDFFVHQVV